MPKLKLPAPPVPKIISARRPQRPWSEAPAALDVAWPIRDGGSTGALAVRPDDLRDRRGGSLSLGIDQVLGSLRIEGREG